MMGNLFGLFESPRKAKHFLRTLHRMTSRKARIIAETVDPYKTKDPDHLAYHMRNRKRGRMPGQVRMRVRYKKFATPWFDFLLVSKKEMIEILKDTGWRIGRIISDTSPRYVAIIEKDTDRSELYFPC
jgi:hypothetical protein